MWDNFFLISVCKIWVVLYHCSKLNLFYVGTCLIIEDCEGGLSYIRVNVVIHVQVLAYGRMLWHWVSALVVAVPVMCTVSACHSLHAHYSFACTYQYNEVVSLICPSGIRLLRFKVSGDHHSIYERFLCLLAFNATDLFSVYRGIASLVLDLVVNM